MLAGQVFGYVAGGSFVPQEETPLGPFPALDEPEPTPRRKLLQAIDERPCEHPLGRRRVRRRQVCVKSSTLLDFQVRDEHRRQPLERETRAEKRGPARVVCLPLRHRIRPLKRWFALNSAFGSLRRIPDASQGIATFRRLRSCSGVPGSATSVSSSSPPYSFSASRTTVR